MDTEKEIARFTSYMTGERKSPHTIKEYKFLVSLFLNFINKSLETCSTDDVENFKNYLASVKKYSKSSQYLAIKAVRHFYKSKSIPPLVNLTVPKRPRKMPNYLSEKDASRLIEEASKRNLTTGVIISILAHTGIRVGELCNLKISDVDLSESIIYIHSGKGDRDRIVIIPRECKDLLSEYLPQRFRSSNGSDALILSRRGSKFDSSTIERIVRKLGKDAGIGKKVTPHVLRHTFATAVLRNGGDIRFIQQLLGHASVATTQIYTHVDDSTLREMYEKHRPKY